MSAYFSKKLDWNTVDARGSDGLLQYGRVIDCAEHGLLIDFGCGAPAREVAFGQMYRCRLEMFSERCVSDNLEVDVLWRCGRGEPATWYPGVILTGSFELFGPFALVRISTPTGFLAEIVTTDLVRRQRSAAEHGPFLLEKGQFVGEEVQLPSGVSSGSPSPGPYQTPPADQRLIKRFNRNCSRHWMVATHIDGSLLHVLKITDRFRRRFDRDYRSICPELKGDTLLRLLGTSRQTQRKRPNDEQDAVTKRVALSSSTPDGGSAAQSSTFDHSSTFSAALPPQAGSTTSILSVPPPSTGIRAKARVKKRVRAKSLDLQLALDDDSFFEELSLIKSAGINQHLTRNILADIFECLDGLLQVKLRRVCAMWNDILTTVPVSRVLRLREENPIFVSGNIRRACLLKCWTAQTKIIVYVNSGTACDTSGAEVSDADVSDTEADVRERMDKRYFDSLLCTACLFRCIFQEKQLPRLDYLLLVDVTWQWRPNYRYLEWGGGFTNFITHIRDELNSFASICYNLVIKDVSVVLLEENAPVVVHITKARIAGEVSGAALWDLMDGSLQALIPENVACWMEWMKDNSDDELPGRLILNERQSTDPRDSNQFLDRKWIRGHLANLDLEKLNRVTLHSLLKACCYEKLVLVINW